MLHLTIHQNFVNADNANEGDILLITGEGEYEDKTNATTQKKFRVLNIPCKINDGRELTFTPSIDCGKKLVAAWGKETKEWIDKTGKVIHVKYKAFGETKTGVEIEPQ